MIPGVCIASGDDFQPIQTNLLYKVPSSLDPIHSLPTEIENSKYKTDINQLISTNLA